MSDMLTLEKFEEASEIVKKVTSETKLIYSEYLSSQTENKVYLKPENMQLTGAYKVRGAYYKISTLSPEEREKGLITASAGNHAQGVAYAAKKYDVHASIVMPTTTPLMKVNRTKGYGAEVILKGDVYDEACEYAYQLAEEKGYTPILHAELDWMTDGLVMEELMDNPLWVAEYSTNLTYTGTCRFWQYTARGTVEGISGYTGLIISYENRRDFQ